jgi:UDP-N-acetylmuramyl tripeptide synthase
MPKILFFPYFGPSRRSEKRLVELRLDFANDHGTEFPEQPSDIRQILIAAEILAPQEHFPEQALSDDRMAWYSSLLVQTALLFQRKNGHRVDFSAVSCEPAKKRCVALMEHEDTEVGMAAVKLAAEIFSGRLKDLAEPYRQYSKFARDRVLPFETEAIIEASRRRNIPCIQLDREPLAGKLNTGIRVRPNGLLSLGHGAGIRVLDGTFYVDVGGDYLRALLKNPAQRKELLIQLGIPTLDDVPDGNAAVGLFHLLVINGKVTALSDSHDGERQLVKDVNDEWIEYAVAISEKLGSVPISVTVKAANIEQSPRQAGGVVADFELAPDLYALLGQCQGQPDLLRSVAGDLVDDLFPDRSSARIPVIAVTGTNGKTTASHMVDHILQGAGYKTGLVCTDGIFLNNRPVSRGDASAFIGHARVLTSKQVDAAVLEAHHRGMAVRGFAFDHCNIAVCLNVTHEHLADGEIETLDEMAEIKRSLLERARDGAVLNADNLSSIAMKPHLEASRVCLVSSRQSKADLRKFDSDQTLYCLAESHQGEEWVVIHDGNKQQPVLPVSAMPCTFGGAARFNLENAMAAMAAAYLLGVSPLILRSAMQLFKMGREHTPGRLNHYRHLPFSAFIDFAHNPDGYARLTEFASGLKVSGKRLLLISGAGDRPDAVIANMARSAAGKFDHYVCRSYPNTRGRDPREVPAIQRAALLEEGVPESAISVEIDAGRAIDLLLGMADATDLVMLPLSRSEFESTHQRLIAMQAGVRKNDSI